MKARFVFLTALVALIALPALAQERRQITRTTVSRREPQLQDRSRTIVSRRERQQPQTYLRTTNRTRVVSLVWSRSNYRNYNYYGRGYDYGYGGYGGYYTLDGYSGPLAIGGAAIATAFKSSAPGVVGAVVLGWLLGQHLDNVKAQQPVENVEWSEDSNGNRYWQKSGVQTRIARPAWVDPPANKLPEQAETDEPAEEPANEPDATVVP